MNDHNQPEEAEVECPYFDPAWVQDHPDFPLAEKVRKAMADEQQKEIK